MRGERGTEGRDFYLSTVPGGNHWDEFFVISRRFSLSKLWTAVTHDYKTVSWIDRPCDAKSRHSTGVILYWQTKAHQIVWVILAQGEVTWMISGGKYD